MRDIYPVTIFKTRYGGAYEGAPWVAVNEDTGSEWLWKAQSDDITCFLTWERAEEDGMPLGRGYTPEDAYEDLVRTMGMEVR